MKLISVAADGFHEPGLLARLGETITFQNHDTKDHEVSGGDAFDTFTLKVGENKDVVLKKAGQFPISSKQFAQKGSINVQT